MLLCYLIALIPVFGGAIAWGLNKRVVWFEWLAASAAAFLVAGLFHIVVVNSMTGDTETWSGHVVKTTYYPEWVEEYEVAIYRTETYTDSDGKTQTRQVFSHYEKRYRTHRRYWAAADSIRYFEVEIDKSTSDDWAHKFGGYVTTKPHKSGFYSGDPNVYVAENKTGFLIPTTDSRSFENRVKAAPSLFSYVQPAETIKLFEYPKNENWLASDRLVGFAGNTIDLNEFDKMNARLGPSKKVNVIMVDFGPHTEQMMSQYQEAKWIGGKKNDVIIMYGGGEAVGKPKWCRVVGWTEKENCKRNLETIILEAERVNTSLLPKIEQEITANYVIKDWTKFDYITVEPPDWAYFVLLGVMILTQCGIWVWVIKNEADKCEYQTRALDSKVEAHWERIKAKWNLFVAHFKK